MQPLIVILAAGEGTRLYPITEKIPKGMVDIGSKELIDWKVESLPVGIKKAVFLRDSKIEQKFLPLEERLRKVHGFGDDSIIYQDRLISLGYMPGKFDLQTEEIAYYLSAFFRSAGYQGKFEPVIFVPVDTLVQGIDYLELLAHHRKEDADVTMVMKEGFNRGSNTRVYTVENGRFVAASSYKHPEWEDRGCPEDMEIRMEPRQKILTHEGTYVIGSRFSEVSLHVLGKCFLESDFSELFKELKVVPYVTDAYWIDVRDAHNLKLARQRFRR